MFVVFLVYIFLNHSYVQIDIVPNYNLNSVSSYNKIHEDNSKLEETVKTDNNFEWEIVIPKIELSAKIAEGTSEEILNNYVGHFEETVILNGNVGLAAHNRGYNVNYFSRIKELETGDEIIYKYNGNLKKYIVKNKEVIKETDWSFLQETEDNRITLITCVENQPEYRRCIQAIEKKEE